MKKKTKIILLVIAILVIICIVAIALRVTSNLKQEKKLGDELDSLYGLLDNYPIDYESLDTKLSTTITTGDYAKVERAVKDYSGDFMKYMKQFYTLTDDKDLINAIGAENIKKDGPDFANTKKKLSETKTSLNTILTNLSNYFTEEFVLSYIKDSELDEYYINLYKQYVRGDNLAEMQSDINGIIKSVNSVKTLVENEEEIIDFLAKNNGSWKIENDKLLFYSESLSNEYNAIVTKMKELYESM